MVTAYAVKPDDLGTRMFLHTCWLPYYRDVFPDDNEIEIDSGRGPHYFLTGKSFVVENIGKVSEDVELVKGLPLVDGDESAIFDVKEVIGLIDEFKDCDLFGRIVGKLAEGKTFVKFNWRE